MARLLGYDSYNLYRGSLDDLTDGDGDGIPDAGFGVCMNHLDPDTADNEFIDDAMPGSGQGWFYLMARMRGGEETLIGATSAGLPRTPASPCSLPDSQR